MRTLVCLVLLLPVAHVAYAQDSMPGNWIMYFGKNTVHKRLSIHSEVQYRSEAFVPDLTQLLTRIGLNLHVSDQTMLTGGYGYITNAVLDIDNEKSWLAEHRIWQQLILNQAGGRFKFEHRYRSEQRFISNNFSTRYRYRLMLTAPIGKPKMEDKTLFLGLYDEIFINGTGRLFDRNRAYAALGYKHNSAFSVQVGWLAQTVATTSGKGITGQYFQLGVFLNPDFRNGK